MRIVRIHARLSDWRQSNLDHKLTAGHSIKKPDLPYELDRLMVNNGKMTFVMEARPRDELEVHEWRNSCVVARLDLKKHRLVSVTIALPGFTTSSAWA
jgi:hypothetical protein